MWERFSYYGMRALLILFMTARWRRAGWASTPPRPDRFTALYVSSVYLLSLPGGWVADRVLGLRRAVFVGGVIIMRGHICLAMPSITTFYLGLVLISVGTGLLKPNVERAGGQALRRRTTCGGTRVLDLLHGHQYRRVHRAADLRLAGAERGLPRDPRVGRLLGRTAPGTGASARRRWACSAAGPVLAGREAPLAGRAAPGPAERPGGRGPGGPPGAAGRARHAGAVVVHRAGAGGVGRWRSTRRRSPATSSGCCSASRSGSSPGCS